MICRTRWSFPENRTQNRKDTITGKRAVARDHLVKHCSKAENVTAMVYLLRFSLFRAHVTDSARDHSLRCYRLGSKGLRRAIECNGTSLDNLGEPEIQQLDCIRRADNDVARL